MFAFPLIIARKKLVGQRVTVENQIRGLAVLFGIRLPARSPQRSSTRLSKPAKDRGSLCRHTGIDCGTHRCDDGGRRDRRRHEAHDKGLCRLPPADDNPR
jgi:hypothetical protein